jgi:hypothetical protein
VEQQRETPVRRLDFLHCGVDRQSLAGGREHDQGAGGVTDHELCDGAWFLVKRQIDF